MWYKNSLILLLYIISYTALSFSSAHTTIEKQLKNIKQQLVRDQEFLCSLSKPENIMKWKRSKKNLERLLETMDTRLNFYEKIVMDKTCKPLWNYTIQITQRLLSMRNVITFSPEKLKNKTLPVGIRAPKFLRTAVKRPTLATIYEETECKEQLLLDTDDDVLFNMPN